MTSPSTMLSFEKLSGFLAVLQMLTQELELDRLLQLIMEKTSVALGADRSTLFMVDAEKEELWSRVAQGVERQEIRIPMGQGIAGTVAVTGETVNIRDAYRDARFNPEVDRKTGYRTQTILCMPVRNTRGHIVAVLQALNKREGTFAGEDEDLLRALGGPIAIALRNAQYVDQIQRRRRISEILLSVMKAFSAELDVDQLLKTIMAKTSEAMNADRSTLFLVDRRTGELWSKVAEGAGTTEIRVPIGQGIAGTVAATGTVINIPDAYEDPRFDRAVDRKTGYTTRTILCAPIQDTQGEVVGVAQVLNKAGGVFTREDEELLAALCAQAYIALENARLFEAVMTMKNYNESILHCMATGVMAVDREGRVTSVNPAFRRIFGLGADTPSCAGVAGVLDGGRNEDLVVRVHDCALRGEAYTAYELKYLLPSGDALGVNLSVVPLQDSKRNPLGIVVVAEDITQEQRLMSTLCRYVTREVAEQVMKDSGKLRLGGNRQPVSILFSDIRNFTTLTEQSDPEDIVAFLNEYFSLMVQEIFAEGGSLDKFIGDAIMAVFGALVSRPDDPSRAVRAALRMRRVLRTFNEGLARRGRPTIETGIGICHGEVISGNIGSEQRMEYTVIGDPVNLASRLENLTKMGPHKILINEVIYQQVRDHFECVLVGEEKVKGKTRPVMIYGVREPAD